MPSKYIFLRLAQTPFLEPTASKTRLSQEFTDELDVRRQSVALSHEQEEQDWLRQANEALMRSKTKDAKKYVWSEFAHALDPDDEPRLFMAGYQWLHDNQEWAPPRKTSLLDWKDDHTFSCGSLLCAASQLPNSGALDYIARWVATQQQELAASADYPRMLPVQKMRLNKDKETFYNTRKTDYQNQILWKHVLAPSMAVLPENLKHALRVPYLPFALESSLVEDLLSKIDSHVHTWVLSNALFVGDFVPANINLVEESNAIKCLSRFSSTLDKKEDKAFVVWDMIHRRPDIAVAEHIVEIHAPNVKKLLDGLGMLQIDDLRQAMLTQWHKPSQLLASIELPVDLHADLVS